MNSRAILVGVAAVIMMAGNGFACGPFFDDAYLVRGSEQEFLSMPEGDFRSELEKISGKKSNPSPHDKITWDNQEAEYEALRTDTSDADINDLKEAMKASTLPEREKEKAIMAYTQMRSAITEYLRGYVPTNPWIWYGDQFRSKQKDAVAIKMSVDPALSLAGLVPKEFVLYSEGAIKYHNGDLDGAIAKWKELLSLPPVQRKYRSVWAAFMIGKACTSVSRHREGVEYFGLSRQLAAQGYKDSLKLAQESYGWQALAEYEDGQYAAALNHYLQAMDVLSIDRVCRTIAGLNDEDFEAVLKNETALRIMIAWVVSHSSYHFYSNDENEDYIRIARRLTSAIVKNDIKVPTESADRIAWMFYNLGEFKNADRWLIISREQTALAQWIRTKLLIRDGKIDRAIEMMRALKYSFAQDAEFNEHYGKVGEEVERKINAEHSILLLHRNEYLTAFGVLLQGAYWEDIAYVAEKVLTVDELEKYLKSHDVPGDEKALGFCYAVNIEKPTVKKALEYLLARRLARNGNLQRALEYMPDVFTVEEYAYNSGRSGERFSPKEKMQEYIDLLNRAEDRALSKEDRAHSYYSAARLIRRYGMELMGTELDPDWFVFNGQFDYDDPIETKFAIVSDERMNNHREYEDKAEIRKINNQRAELLKQRSAFFGSEDEERRVLSALPAPQKRFHYRYKASDLMWKAAELLPNNDDLKAMALCLGGTYLKNRDPKEADKFYKALVGTCGKTALGKEADKMHWFPRIPEAI